MAKKYRPTYNLLCTIEGSFIVMTKAEYLKNLRDPEGCNIEIRGKILPVNKQDLIFEEVKPKQKTKLITCKHFTYDHLRQINNLVALNASTLARRNPKEFMTFFNSLVINKLKKPFAINK